MGARVDHAVTSGTFTLDGETFDVDNNVWVVGDDEECVVLDAPHDVAATEPDRVRVLRADVAQQAGAHQPAAIARLAAATTRSTLGRYFISSRNSGMCVS